MNLLERLFKLRENGTTPGNEFRGGLTTFLTMAYILFVQPAVLSIAGMSPVSVFWATCLSSAFATILMGFVANYPIALAPGMGENFFFVFSVALIQIGGEPVGWPAALAVVFISGLLFVLLSVIKVRKIIFDAVPAGLRYGIAVGIGLFVAEIGLLHSGLVRMDKTTLLPDLGHLSDPPVLLSLLGLLVTVLLYVRQVRGAILWGILVGISVALAAGMMPYEGIVQVPDADFSTFWAMDFGKILGSAEFIVFILVFLYMDLFDTLGTMIGVTEQAGLIDEKGRLPRAGRVLLCDSIGTVAGAAMGTSTVTSYIESAAGVGAGARTGLANLVTGGLFILALFFQPIVSLVGKGMAGTDGGTLYPITAPALILVGSMMMTAVGRIQWKDPSESLPAFLVILGIPLTFSIADGLAFGFISYPLIQVFRGRFRETSPALYVIGALFLARYVFLAG